MNAHDPNSTDAPEDSGSEPSGFAGGPSRSYLETGLAPEEEERLIALVGFLVQGVVAHPDEVEVEEFFDDAGIVYGVRVHRDDLGRVIGRDGRVANALRSLTRASAIKSGARVTVEVITDESQLRLDEGE